MKRLLFALVPAVLVLAACDAGTESTAYIPPSTDRVLVSTTVAPPVDPPKVEPNVSTGDLIDDVMRSVAADESIRLPVGMGGEYADIVCTGFGDGLAFPLIVQIAADALPDWSVEQHAFLVGASVGSACPEYVDSIAGGAA